jgi:hypothetical protein
MEVDPTPTPTKTGIDYAAGIEYDAQGAVKRYLQTRILTKYDGTAIDATPTSDSYHHGWKLSRLADSHPWTPQDITQQYIDRFEFVRKGPIAQYLEYPYERGAFYKHANTDTSSWSFTSPYTGVRYEGVLPFFSGWERLGDQKTPSHMWFIEIFNDWQAYNGYAQYDPLQDGYPGMPKTWNPDFDWVGWQPYDYGFLGVNTRPPHLWEVVPKLDMGNPVFGDEALAHFNFGTDFSYGENQVQPRRLAVHTARTERDIDPVPFNDDPSISTRVQPIDATWVTPKYTLEIGPPANSSGTVWAGFGDWDFKFDDNVDVPVRMRDGTTQLYKQTNVTLAAINNVLAGAINVNGFLSSVSGQANGQNVFSVFFNTRDQLTPSYQKFGSAINGSPQVWTYRSKWLYQTVFDSSVFSGSDWLSVPNDDRTFPGVAWDGTSTGVPAGSTMLGTRGITAWGSAPHVNVVACKSFQTDPTTEFNGVLQLANAKVFEITGRHQCPFTWHSTLGYIQYHMAM